jgi:hypothetical protein
MRFAILAIASVVLLSGCSEGDWDHLTSFDSAPSDEVAQAAQPVQATAQVAASTPPANAAFCQAVAQQDATGNGFDAATQARVLQQSFTQCMTIYSK